MKNKQPIKKKSSARRENNKIKKKMDKCMAELRKLNQSTMLIKKSQWKLTEETKDSWWFQLKLD